MSDKLTPEYVKISSYMAANKLVINDNKTHLIVMGTKTTSARRGEVVFQAGDHIIRPTRTEKLLGASICEDLKFREHLVTSESSLVKQLTSRLNGLKLISRKTSFKTRLMVANGIFMSKII